MDAGWRRCCIGGFRSRGYVVQRHITYRNSYILTEDQRGILYLHSLIFLSSLTCNIFSGLIREDSGFSCYIDRDDFTIVGSHFKLVIGFPGISLYADYGSRFSNYTCEGLLILRTIGLICRLPDVFRRHNRPVCLTLLTNYRCPGN